MLSNVVAILLAVCATLVLQIGAPPVLPNEVDPKENTKESDRELGLMYEHYLKQVIEYLEQDDAFKEKLGAANMDDITTGKIANELHFVNRNIRSKLDELKRQELHRLRTLARQEHELSNGLDRRSLGWPQHVDARNPNTFEISDLKKLVQQTSRDLEELDRKRRADFKRYEMDKEHQRREALQKLDEENRKRAEKEHEEILRRHKEHPKLHHPGSKQQLEEVWEKEDRMPTEDFNPKTFFRMHDLDGDDNWNEEEVKSLFRRELDKMYEQNNTDDDMQERLEEMDRMREHVVNETDTNRDGLISIAEFLDMTRRNEFNQDPGWEGLDEQPIYDENELREYERQLQMGMVPQDGVPVYVPGGVYPGDQYQHIPPGGYHPQQNYPHAQNVQQQQQPNFQGYHDPGYHPQQFQQPGGEQYQYQQPAGGIPQQQYQHPGGIPQQQFQQPGRIPQQQFQQPGGIPQQQFQHPGGIPQQQFQQPGGIPQQQFQQPGGIPQQQFQQPGGAQQQQFQQPGRVPQQQPQQSGGIPQQTQTQQPAAVPQGQTVKPLSASDRPQQPQAPPIASQSDKSGVQQQNMPVANEQAAGQQKANPQVHASQTEAVKPAA